MMGDPHPGVESGGSERSGGAKLKRLAAVGCRQAEIGVDRAVRAAAVPSYVLKQPLADELALASACGAGKEAAAHMGAELVEIV